MKSIGTASRLELEDLLDSKVMLKIWVKVKNGWADNEFDEGDQITIDSLFVIGGYTIFQGNRSDKIRFTIFKGGNGFSAPFAGVQYNPGTWAALDPTATPTAKTNEIGYDTFH